MVDRQINRSKPDTDLGILVVRQMARVMEQKREHRGMTKLQLAQLCDMTSPYYLRILDGSANPSIHVICRIANGLKISLEELLLGAPSRAKRPR